MDSITLATTVAAFLSPHLAKAGEKAVEEVGKKLPNAVGTVWQTIMARFKGKPTAADAVQDLVASPDDQLYQLTFANQLRKALEAEPAFVDELAHLLSQAQNAAGSTIINVGSGAVAQGPGAVAAGERGVAIGGNVHGSTIITGSTSAEGQAPSERARWPRH